MAQGNAEPALTQEVKGMDEPGTKAPVEELPFSHPLLEVCKKHGDPDKLRVTVLFECDGCCVKALNGKIVDIVAGFLVLVARDESFILVRIISEEEIVDKEVAKVIIIPLDRICAIEIGGVQVDS